MEALITLYALPHDASEPVICFDEQSVQCLQETRTVLKRREGQVLRRDHEYKRNGTTNIFMAVEPKRGYRSVTVTDRRTRVDFAVAIRDLIALPRYASAFRIHLVCDNLNTHFPSSFFKAFPKREAQAILKRIAFHYTPKHASWLDMAEIELSILSRQCLKRRLPDRDSIIREINHWQRARNKHHATIKWKFTLEDARNVFRYCTRQNLLN
jgi:hypothetical protein